MGSIRRRVQLAVLAALAIPCAAHASVWVGGTGNWNVAANWTPGIPGNNDTITINQAGAVVNYIQPSQLTYDYLAVQSYAGVTLNQFQDTLRVRTFRVSDPGSIGTYNFSGGSLYADAIVLSDKGTFTGSSDVSGI